MNNKEYNNDFFGYNGCINRKNYIINMLILAAIAVISSFIDTEALFKYSSVKILIQVLNFAVSTVIFVVIFSCLSLVYRRITDITFLSSENVKNVAKKIFAVIFVLPAIYLLCIRYFIDEIPFISGILDLAVLFVLLPSAILCSLFIGIYKGNNR